MQPEIESVAPTVSFPKRIIVIPINNPPIFPGMMAPLAISRKMLTPNLEAIVAGNGYAGIILAKKAEDLKVTQDDLFRYGTIVKVLKKVNLPEGDINLLVHSQKRFRVSKFIQTRDDLFADVEYVEDILEMDPEQDAFARSIVAKVKKLSETNPLFTEEMKLAMLNVPNPGALADLVAFSLHLPNTEAQDFLETLDVKARFKKLLVYLKKEQDVSDLQKRIQDEVNTRVSKTQREFFLKEQLKAIKKELGGEGESYSDIQKFEEKLSKGDYPDDVKKLIKEELQKLETTSDMSPEYNVTRTYIDFLVNLPWRVSSKDNLDVAYARKVLNKDHYGLEKVKERIIEFLAVKKLKKDFKGNILCFVGPPGVGKTSLGRSVAKALNKEFFRFSLGGMRDEAEIKGHRRTYVGAMPGKILQGLKRVGVNNPIMMLDEIDKLGNSYQGDPSSALLEVLDPEQNFAFLDHYIDHPFDLSHVFFIATANSESTIPEPLLDRMEIIEIPGYTLEEKLKICQDYVIPQGLEKHGLKASSVSFPTNTLKVIMRDYAREPGVRSLQQCINTILRKVATAMVEGKKRSKAVEVKDLYGYLGPERFYNEIVHRISTPGVIVGLAYTSLGGDVLFIEATNLPGKGDFVITGQVGGVMHESARIAYGYVRKKVVEMGITTAYFNFYDIHLHLPAGAVPKDGPSAGITMASAIFSLIMNRKAKPNVAMTGELSLVGKVLPVGGIKEKVLAAKRVGIKTIIMPALNKKDLREINPQHIKGLTFKFVDHVDEVFDLVLEPAKTVKVRNVDIKKALKMVMPEPPPPLSTALPPEKLVKKKRI